jgi:hypothetical protein
LGEAWEGIPAEFRKLLPPEWPLPNDLPRWQSVERAKVRATVLQCLGDLPPRPARLEVKRLGREEMHGVYYFVPGLLKHFDTEAVYALVAPRPLLMLSGDRDGGLPLDGIEVLEKKLGEVYRLHGRADRFRSIVYKNTAHEYLPEMQDEMLAWFEKHLAAKAR